MQQDVGGHSMADHYAVVARATGKAVVEPEMPAELTYLWNHFSALHRRRQAGFAPNPLTWTEIASYAKLTASALEPWEAQVIAHLDDLYMDSLASTGVEEHES